MTPDTLHSLPAYTSWSTTNPATSSLLVLGGKTAPGARTSPGYTHSWLSPAALHVVESIRSNGGRAAFYCCHPGTRADESSHTGRDVVVSLAYQVLEWEPKVLRRKMAQLRAVMRSEGWRGGEGEDIRWDGNRREIEKAAVKAWFLLLREVLAEVSGDGTVYLVVDRVDLVEGCAVRYFMEGLVDLVQDEKCLVKILVVMNTARGVWDADGMEEEGKAMVLQDLDQKRVGLAGMSKLVHSRSYQG
jgi:hypothetical protein